MSEVQAAGGVVVRDGAVLAVHRPRYDDWSLPKGKLEDGEFVPSHEVDEVRWLAPADAGRLLTYEHDRELLREVTG